MNEQIQKLQDEIMVLMSAKNQRGERVYDVDAKYRAALWPKSVELQKLKDAEAATVRVSAEDQARNAEFAKYQEVQAARRALSNHSHQMSTAEILKAEAIVKGTAPATVVKAPATQPVGRGGIFSKAAV